MNQKNQSPAIESNQNIQTVKEPLSPKNATLNDSLRPDNDQFITFKELEKCFKESSATIRTILKRLIKESKLIEGQDFLKIQRGHTESPKNFYYKVNLNRFVEEVVNATVNDGDNALISLKDKIDQYKQNLTVNDAFLSDNDRHNASLAGQDKKKNKEQEKPEKSVERTDNAPLRFVDGIVMAKDEMIQFLKEQINKKDEQIKNKDKRVEKLSERLNDREKKIQGLISESRRLQGELRLLTEPRKHETEEYVPKKKGFWGKLFG